MKEIKKKKKETTQVVVVVIKIIVALFDGWDDVEDKIASTLSIHTCTSHIVRVIAIKWTQWTKTNHE